MVLQVNSMEVQYYDIQMNELVRSAFKHALTSVKGHILGGKNVIDTGVWGGKLSYCLISNRSRFVPEYNT